MTPMRLEPAALRSRVKHSTTELMRSLQGYNHTMVIYAQFKLHEILLICYLVLAEDEKRDGQTGWKLVNCYTDSVNPKKDEDISSLYLWHQM